MAKTYYMREGQMRLAPFSLRLTVEERRLLESRAGTMPLGSYIKSLIFAENAPSYRKRKKSPVQDHKTLADVLACLGSSRIANNLNQLAHAANCGNLYFDEQTNLPFFKRKLTELSRELYLEHEWTLPEGLRTNGGRSPLNFTLDEWQQAKRLGSDPREVKDTFRDAWARSDSLPALKNALEERGYYLAKGDRRGIVAVDVEGEVFALARWSNVKTKDLRVKIGDGVDLPSVADTKRDLSRQVGKQLKAFIGELRERHGQQLHPVRQELAALKKSHVQERGLLDRQQAERWAAETDARAKRLRTGLAGLWDTLSGKAKAIRHENEADAMAGLARDRAQRDGLSLEQRQHRQSYQADIDRLKLRHAQDRKLMAREVSMHLRKLRAPPNPSRDLAPQHERTRRRGGFSLDL